jgi:tRNA A37 N6-isopentenylltransferase MiaA
MARVGAMSLRELTAVEKNIYIGLKAIHKTDVQQYQRYLTEIAQLWSKILTTIAKEKRAMLQADKTIRVWITNLQTSTRPTNAQMTNLIWARLLGGYVSQA